MTENVGEEEKERERKREKVEEKNGEGSTSNFIPPCHFITGSIIHIGPLLLAYTLIMCAVIVCPFFAHACSRSHLRCCNASFLPLAFLFLLLSLLANLQQRYHKAIDKRQTVSLSIYTFLLSPRSYLRRVICLIVGRFTSHPL